MGGWRTVLVSKSCRLTTKNQQLIYAPKDASSVHLPLEDISVIVIETNQASMSTALLSACAEKNIVLFSCDNYHIPNGIFTPFHQHSRLSHVAHLQQRTKLPLKKKLWQKIVIQKITNQAELLKILKKDDFKVSVLKDKVKSGDTQNVEALAARHYWKILFKDFKRQRESDDARNIALNYGYALIRGVVARSLVSYGLLPTFGIFHNSELNAYNLADDIIEPLRPLVDMVVKQLEHEELLSLELTTQLKSALLSVLDMQMYLAEQKVTLLSICERMAYSFVNALREEDATLLELPRMISDI